MADHHQDIIIAKRYATALFAITGAKDVAVGAEAGTFLEALQQGDLDKFINNPLISRDKSSETIALLLRKMNASEVMRKFAVRVAENRRLPLLPAMLKQYLEMLKAARGEMDVTVTAARPMDDKEIGALTDALAKLYGKTIHASLRVDPSILGGIRLKIGDTLLDHSIAGRLNRMKDTLKSAPLLKGAA